MATSSRRRSSYRGKSGRSPARRPDRDTCAEFPDLGALRALLVSDGDLLDPGTRTALHQAIQLIDAIAFEGYAAVCGQCGEPAPGVESPRAPIRCPPCMFWGDRAYTDRASANINVPNVHSIRCQGQHYTIDGRDEDGPVMTVRFFSGATIVTTRLRTQGPVPPRWTSILPDNAVVEEGNPYQLPRGITRP